MLDLLFLRAFLHYYNHLKSSSLCCSLSRSFNNRLVPFVCSARLHRLRKKCFGCHSERSEESLRVQNKRLRGILRARSALRMTVFRLFPQTVQAGICLHRQCRPEGRRYKTDSRMERDQLSLTFLFPVAVLHHCALYRARFIQNALEKAPDRGVGKW